MRKEPWEIGRRAECQNGTLLGARSEVRRGGRTGRMRGVGCMCWRESRGYLL